MNIGWLANRNASIALVFGLLALLAHIRWRRDNAPGWLVGAVVAFTAALFWLDSLPAPLWTVCAGIFVLAWIGQFIGHMVEGKRPSFFQDMQFLMIGPMWLLSFVYRRMGIRY